MTPPTVFAVKFAATQEAIADEPLMKLAESNDPKKKAFQLFVPACTAAA